MNDSIQHHRHGLLTLIWEGLVGRTLRDVDAECRAFQATDASRRFDYKTTIVLVTTAVILTIQAYVSGADVVEWIARLFGYLGYQSIADALLDALDDPARAQLYRLLAWAGIRAVEWLLVPALIIRFVFRERVTDYGIKLQGLLRAWWVYLAMLAFMLPLLIYFSYKPSFLRTYPYYRLEASEPLWPNLWCWELAYCGQFFCLEFFFRGFMVQGTRHRFGAYSILVMTIPYCMIHFGKPMPETLGSIVAGVVLGFMALRTRSVWLGTALHISVAMTMDFLALAHGGRLG